CDELAVTVHVSVPEHAPLQPWNVELAAVVTVNVTVLPAGYPALAVQNSPTQEITPSVDETTSVSAPAPVFTTWSWTLKTCFGAGTPLPPVVPSPMPPVAPEPPPVPAR